jgi:hypothetical protein
MATTLAHLMERMAITDASMVQACISISSVASTVNKLVKRAQEDDDDSYNDEDD